MTLSIDYLKADKTRLLDELRKCSGWIESSGDKSNCPFHAGSDSQKKRIYEESGRWFFKCFSCGWQGDFMDVIATREGRDVKEVYKELTGESDRKSVPVKETPKPPRHFADYAAIEAAHLNLTLEARYEYTNPDTQAVEAVVYRYRRPDGKKHMPQFTPADGGGWNERGLKAPKPLYNRARLRRVKRCVVVEGENKVHKLHEYGIVGTCVIGGSQSARQADWSPLATMEEVILWPDNDEPGRQFIAAVRDEISKVNSTVVFKTVRVNELGLKEKEDVVDYVNHYPDVGKVTVKKILEDVLADAAPDKSCVDGLIDRIKAMGSGELITVGWFSPFLTKATKSLMNGTVTVLAGDPGCSKTLWVFQNAIQWHQDGYTFAIYELEDDHEYHMHRMMAIHHQDARIVDDEWLRDGKNADLIARFAEDHRELYEKFGRRVFTVEDRQETMLTYADILAWIEMHAKRGTDVIVIDPITAIEPKGKIHEEDLRFTMAAKQIVRKTKTRLILVTHKRKSYEDGNGYAQLSGGAAFGRFSQSILSIEQVAIERKFSVKKSSDDYPETMQCNRIVRVIKARNSYGAGMAYSYTFDKTLYKFVEHGVILKNDRGKDGTK